MSAMHVPLRDGAAKNAHSIVHMEVGPPQPLAEFVHCFLELHTRAFEGSPRAIRSMSDPRWTCPRNLVVCRGFDPLS